MHPILGRVDRLAVYLAVWLTACVLVAGVFTRFGLSWTESLALLVPLFSCTRSSACRRGT